MALNPSNSGNLEQLAFKGLMANIFGKNVIQTIGERHWKLTGPYMVPNLRKLVVHKRPKHRTAVFTHLTLTLAMVKWHSHTARRRASPRVVWVRTAERSVALTRAVWDWQPHKVAPQSECKWNHRNWVNGVSTPECPTTPSPDWNCQWGPSGVRIAYTRAMSEHRCFPSTHTMHFKWHHRNLSKNDHESLERKRIMNNHKLLY